MTAITTVVFDLGGVVFDYRPADRRRRFAAITGLPEADVQKRLFDSGYSASCDSGRLSGTRLFDEGVRVLGQRMSLERFRDAWISAFTPNPAVIEIAKRLKERFPLALLTNNSDLVRDGLVGSYPDTMALFRPQFFSCDFGIQKPHPKIFETALSMLDLEPVAVLFIDDAPKHVAGAASLGLSTIRYQSPEQLTERLEALGLLDHRCANHSF